MPFKAFVMAAGATALPAWRFAVAMGLGRSVRHFSEAALARLYGDEAVQMMQTARRHGGRGADRRRCGRDRRGAAVEAERMTTTHPAGPLLEPSVDVWVVSTARLDVTLIPRLASLMTPDEAARTARFVREVDRHTFVVTRALVRTLLSRYGPTRPADWRFTTNAHACPFVVDAQAGVPPLCFNVSHTAGLVALAVARGHRVGVDVEDVDRRVLEDVPERHFAPSEVRDLRALPEAEQPVVFFDYWTLKEAYIKARGMGLALPLDQFAFSLHGDAAPTIHFVPGFDDDPAHWQFFQAWPTPHHRLALAVERSGPDLPVVLRPAAAESLVP